VPVFVEVLKLKYFANDRNPCNLIHPQEVKNPPQQDGSLISKKSKNVLAIIMIGRSVDEKNDSKKSE